MYDHAAHGAELIAALEQVTKEFENDPPDTDYYYDCREHVLHEWHYGEDNAS